MNYIFQSILDFIFPPNREEVFLRTIPIDWLNSNGKRASQTEFPFIYSLFSYKDSLIKELIWQIKYKKNKYAIKCASFALYTELLKRNMTNVLLIPIPISKKRRKERGYNQCELIIDEIIKLDKEKMLEKNYQILTRPIDIPKQTLKNRNERIENIKNIFEINKSQKHNNINSDQKIVIIDDVTTTGSTLKEAFDSLNKAGYRNIEAFTIAH